MQADVVVETREDDANWVKFIGIRHEKSEEMVRSCIISRIHLQKLELRINFKGFFSNNLFHKCEKFWDFVAKVGI